MHMDNKNTIRNSQHGFTKGKSRLINPITFYEEATSWMGEGGAVDIVNFSKASVMKSSQANSKRVHWIENWLNSRFWGSLSAFSFHMDSKGWA